MIKTSLVKFTMSAKLMTLCGFSGSPQNHAKPFTCPHQVPIATAQPHDVLEPHITTMKNNLNVSEQLQIHGNTVVIT